MQLGPMDILKGLSRVFLAPLPTSAAAATTTATAALCRSFDEDVLPAAVAGREALALPEAGPEEAVREHSRHGVQGPDAYDLSAVETREAAAVRRRREGVPDAHEVGARQLRKLFRAELPHRLGLCECLALGRFLE